MKLTHAEQIAEANHITLDKLIFHAQMQFEGMNYAMLNANDFRSWNVFATGWFELSLINLFIKTGLF